jgi:hypothetical protein
LTKLKSKLEQFVEYQKENPTARRKRVKIVTELDQFFKLISPEARQKIFREKSDEKIWKEPNSTEEHRTRVIDWVDAKIADEMAKGFKGAAVTGQASKIDDTRKPKRAATKRSINMRESPPCPIDESDIDKDVTQAWRHQKEHSTKQKQTHQSIYSMSCHTKM